MEDLNAINARYHKMIINNRKIKIFPYIKMKVDAEDKTGMYCLSGSQAFSLMKGVSESLAGRAGIVEMNSFTYSEIRRAIKGKIPFKICIKSILFFTDARFSPVKLSLNSGEMDCISFSIPSS